MVNPKELRALADSRKDRDGKAFMIEHIKKIEGAMTGQAEKGLYELKISDTGVLNIDGWLSKSHLYNPIIEKLKNDGFEVRHSDDTRDGTYIIIKW